MRNITVIIILFLSFFILAASASAFVIETVIGNPTGEGLPRCTTLDANPRGCLSNDLNITVTGSFTDDQIRSIYNDFWRVAGKSRAYWELLKEAGPSVNEDNSLPGEGCFAKVENGNIYIQAYNKCSDTLLIHESGHVFAGKNSRYLIRRFPYEDEIKNSGAACVEDRCNNGHAFIKTYSLRDKSCDSTSNPYPEKCTFGVSPKGESFAEALVDYTTPGRIGRRSSTYCSVAIENYKSDCKNAYAWMRDNVFGGAEF
ncbi:MAG: hypothetical protein A3B38_03650 [Candidatus Levybacteria bacterium RIFCSPLOWO2_01_FULL_36_13]|nr:MAG: hypothetical protein A2684_00585 [Candidatus Levybacteria bacterium RIFCSPHIGHO2_01_FULL_36_15b]OGH34226.1 MAG: hypothetical protein A3B38_03650 [Candidatus Levybacteria bacterium RIFCSPLOWO2_01_FULL_36_13]